MNGWKIEMEAVYRAECVRRSADITHLYLQLEKISTRHIEDGTMTPGEEFIIPLSTSGTLKMRFYNPYSEVYLFNKKSNSWDLLLSKEQNAKEEYKSVLNHFSTLLENNDLCIGEKYPGELKQYLAAMKAGQMINFNNGKCYVCTKDVDFLHDDRVYLKPVYSGTLDKITELSFFQECEKDVVLDVESIQRFYEENRSFITGSICVKKIDLITTAQQYLNKLYGELQKGTSIAIQLGNIQLIAKRSLFKKDISFYNSNGEKVDNDTVKCIIGYFSSYPMETIFEHNESEPSFKDFAEDYQCKKTIEKAIATGNKMDVFDIMRSYVLESKGSVLISNRGYEQNGCNFSAVGYDFVYENGDCRLYKVLFKDNDIHSVKEVCGECDVEEFYKFLLNMYDENCHVIEDKNIHTLDELYPSTENYAKQTKEKIAHNLALEGKTINSDGHVSDSHKDNQTNFQIQFDNKDIASLIHTKMQIEKQQKQINNKTKQNEIEL